MDANARRPVFLGVLREWDPPNQGPPPSGSQVPGRSVSSAPGDSIHGFLSIFLKINASPDGESLFMRGARPLRSATRG